jgi:hypothetical protein
MGLAFGFWALPCAAAPAARSAAADCRGGEHFRCRLPAGWTQSWAPRLARVEKVYGLEASAPGQPEGPAVRITVDYFAGDNAVHKGADAYVAAHSRRNQALRMPGEKYGPVSGVELGGRRGRVFERETFAFWPPDHPRAGKVPMRERFVVLPAKEGFYALSYSAPAPLYERYRSAFEVVLESFVPLRRP